MALLKAEDLVAGYGKLTIVHGVSVEIEKGELVALIGPNGSGKSTLIKALMGYCALFGGKVTYDGTDVTGWTADKLCGLGVGYVPQVANVFSSLSIRENLEMGGSRISEKSTLKSRINEIYSLFPDLQELGNQAAGNLSGGERQMLAVARALMMDPQLLLADEPTAGLSPKVMARMLDKIREISGSGTAILIAEQNVNKALEIAHRAYVMVSGECVRTAPTKTLIADKEFARTYLGIRS